MNQEDAVKDFIDAIIRDANAGRNFVPFIGSGLSSPSGIIMGMEFTNYLAFTMYLVLCDPTKRQPTHGEGRSAHWDLSEQGWPPLPSSSEVRQAKNWVSEKFNAICDKLELRINYEKENGLVQSLSPKRENKTPLEDIAHSLSQPPIPLILRAGAAKSDEERVMQFRKMFVHANPGDPLKKMPPWIHSRLAYSESIVEAGVRALADWRETLAFLAMCRVRSGNSPRLTLEKLNPSIIDSFNSSITRDKRPNLGHKIISHLSEPLRVTTLLTTNFDTLTEDAYHSMLIPLAVLPVSSRGDLPHPRTVSSSDTLVKLHGEAHDTRADLSLDDEPSYEDKVTFSAYMQRGTGHLVRRRIGDDGDLVHRSSRLLVVGYSGNDHRCVQMIKHWLETAPDSPQVYWVCFSPADAKHAKELFKSPVYAGRIQTVVTPRPDLLLYELYQRLMLALPPGGLTYEFSHVLPPSRREAFDHTKNEVQRVIETANSASPRQFFANHSRRLLRDAIVMFARDRIVDTVTNCKSDIRVDSILGQVAPWEPVYRISSPSSEMELALAKLKYRPSVMNIAGGVVRGAALATVDLISKQYRKVFWIELTDYIDVDSMLREFLRTFALRHGQFQARHVTMHPFADGLPTSCSDTKETESILSLLVSHISTVLEEYRVDPFSVVVLLCGRDSYGNAAGMVASPWDQGAMVNFKQLHFLIEALGRVGIPTLYFPCTKARSERKRKLINSVVVENALPSTEHGPAPGVREQDLAWPFDELIPSAFEGVSQIASTYKSLAVFHDIVASVLHKLYSVSRRDADDDTVIFRLNDSLSSHDLTKLEFLYALSLFRHSRHTNSVSSEGCFPCPYRFQSCAIDNDFLRSMQAMKWVEMLQKSRVFFTKPGGSLWMHRDVRDAIRSILEQTRIPDFNERQHRTFREMRGRLHFWIGDWYRKAFCSSGHLTPVLESLYHLVSSAIYSEFACPKLKSSERTSKKQSQLLRAHRQMMFESAILQASKLLLLAWDEIELWQASPADVAWLASTHRDKVESLLLEVAARISESDSSSDFKRLKSSVEEFCAIHASVESAVILEGGRSRRGASSWSSSSAIMVRLVPSRTSKNGPISISHGIDEIRRSNDPTFGETFDDLLNSAFKSANGLELWRDLLSVVEGDESARGRFGRVKANWKSKKHKADIQNLVWVLSEAAYVLLRRAKLEFHARGTVSRSTWLKSTLCCNLGIDFCKHLPAWSLGYEIQSRMKMHSIYSVGLANLGRFFEANRHLNEASALRSKWNDGGVKEHAILSIRRAEVKLTECYWLSLFLSPTLNLSTSGKAIIQPSGLNGDTEEFLLPQLNMGATECWDLGQFMSMLDRNDWGTKRQRVLPPNIFECLRQSVPPDGNVGNWVAETQKRLRSLFSAVLDEAVRSLEIAEKSLGGVVQSSLWWSRLHTLRLRVYGLLRNTPEEANLSIIFRKQSADNGIFKTFLSAVRIAGQDDFRRLRALRYFVEANRWYCEFMAPDRFNNGKPDCIDIFGEYLPESLQVAKHVAKDLKQKNTTVRDDDLLRLAIFRFCDQYDELKM